MHVPDGIINAPVSVAAGAVAVTGIAIALKRADRELDDRVAPMAGLVAAFVFAVQMLNFPVLGISSGHLLGGVLAAVLVGPWTAVLCVTVVLLVQGFLFADGGLTALGVNVTNMGIVTVVVGYAVFRLLRVVLPPTRASIVGASFGGALASVPAAAAAFLVMYAVGPVTQVPLGTVVPVMLGVHVLIGIGEALITAATVASVLAVRPDLVYGARGIRVNHELRSAGDRATVGSTR